ncbi:predicted protein [Histoplasma capsulatum H143]|uniref:Uncharacterized protein n=1 Tax=Ajellomyces capsulatus (strain H143) TaxID=544712 RepID=C6HDV0_AJECH|nr:predicted protein [Histoplasma capsulatum H143]
MSGGSKKQKSKPESENSNGLPGDAIETDTKESGRWVPGIISEFVENFQKNNAGKCFINNVSAEDTEKVKEFYVSINKKIEERNTTEGYSGLDLEAGKIKYINYIFILQEWAAIVARATETTLDEAQQLFQGIQERLRKMDEDNNLPEGWSLNSALITDINWMQPHGDAFGYDFQSLKLKSRPVHNENEEVKVLFWWNVGKRKECFVQYGPDSRCVYRIESEDYHDFDEMKVRQIATKDRRSLHKNPKYTGKDIKKILGVAWRSPDEYDPDQLQYIRPPERKYTTKDVSFPRTEVYILFADGELLLEARGGFQRLTGRRILADRMIYTMAEDMERRFKNSTSGRGVGKGIHEDGVGNGGFRKVKEEPNASKRSKARGAAQRVKQLEKENQRLKKQIQLKQQNAADSDDAESDDSAFLDL